MGRCSTPGYISDSNLPIEDEERVSGSGAEATCGMIEGIRNVMFKDNVKAMLSVGESWRVAFNDRAGRVQAQFKEQCTNLDVMNGSALSFKKYDVGSSLRVFVVHFCNGLKWC